MKPGVQLFLVGVLAAAAGLGTGYFLWGGEAALIAEDSGSKLPIGKSLRITKDSLLDENSSRGGDGGDASENSGGVDLEFLNRRGITAGRSIEDILDEPGPVHRWAGVLRVAFEGTDEEVAAALEELQDLPMDVDTIVSKFFLYSRYSDGNPEAAFDSLKDLPAKDRDIAARSMMGTWAAQDPVAAAAYMDGLRDENGNIPGSDDALEALANEWARADPLAALNWSLTLGEKDRDDAVGEVFGRWAFLDPKAAGAAALAMPEDDERKGYFRGIADKWAQRDLEGALTWVESLPEKESSGAHATVVAHWAKEDPVAASLYAWNLPEGEARDDSLRRAAVQWSQKEPAEAANWMVSRAEGEGGQKAMADVVRYWTRKDSMAASAWVAELPPGPTTDHAIVGLSREVSGKDPEGAAIWVNAIVDAQVREEQVKNVAQHWLKKDREAAREWIAAAAISEKAREELLNK